MWPKNLILVENLYIFTQLFYRYNKMNDKKWRHFLFFLGGGEGGGVGTSLFNILRWLLWNPLWNKKICLINTTFQLQFWREIEAPICLYINASLVVFVAAEGGPNKTCLEISKHLKFKNFKWQKFRSPSVFPAFGFLWLSMLFVFSISLYT